MSFARIFSKLSVRARIIVLGVIPVIGFLANGIAFLSGDSEVGQAFDSVHRNTAVADASRDLKIGLLSGNLDSSTVARLRDAAANLKASSGDPGLDSVLSEIELRVEVELAKAGRS